jgi:hypothetical protein
MSLCLEGRRPRSTGDGQFFYISSHVTVLNKEKTLAETQRMSLAMGNEQSRAYYCSLCFGVEGNNACGEMNSGLLVVKDTIAQPSCSNT